MGTATTRTKNLKPNTPLWLSHWDREAHFASFHVCRGSLWLTSKSSGREKIVAPGEDWAWDGKEDWLIEALGDAASIELAVISTAA